MTAVESVIAKMRDWVANPKPQEVGTTRILAFPESDVRALLEHIDKVGCPDSSDVATPRGVTGLGGKMYDIDMAKENAKLKGK